MPESVVDREKRLARLANRYGILEHQLAVLDAMQLICEIPMQQDGADKRAFDLRDLVALNVLENCEAIFELSAPPADGDDLPF